MSELSLPRILVVDDAYGRVRDGRSREREDFCVRTALHDISGDAEVESVTSPIAEAVFLSGQAERGSEVENDLEGTLEQIRSGWRGWPRWSLLLLDLHFKTGTIGPDGAPVGRPEDREPSRYFGLQLLHRIWESENLRDLPVVILSAQPREEVERIFARGGAFGFSDRNALDRSGLAQLLRDHGLVDDHFWPAGPRPARIIGHALPLLKALREARRRATQGNDNMLVLGETGTGKELLAGYVHRWSGRKGPLVTLFTQGAPVTLIEDRLFGHEKGAFTGASSARPGLAEEAHAGTLFIDEFGDIPAAIQDRLLRLLDKNVRETQRLGSTESNRLDLQVVMATNRLDILEESGFRQDLLARAKVRSPILLPPLREREEDLPLLVEHLVRKVEQATGAESREITPEAMAVIKANSWPENVRGLETAIEEAVTTYKGLRSLEPHHLGLDNPTVAPPPSVSPSSHAAPIRGDHFAAPASATPSELAHIVERLGANGSVPLAREQISGSLPEIQRLIALYLKAALDATRTPVTDEVQITPALKLLTGDADLKTTKAADYVKKLLALDPDVSVPMLDDETLKAAYDYAIQQRGGKDIRG